MSTLLQDLRLAVRMLAKNRGFAIVAILTLALGLTVNVTVFSFVNDLFLRPLPAQDPEQLVVMAQKTPKFQYALPFSYADYRDFRQTIEGSGGEQTEMAKTFAGLMAYREEAVHLSRSGETTERTWLHLVSDNYFEVLGVQAQHGRLFLPGEGRNPGADPILVLSHDYWRSRFSGDPRIVGQAVRLNGLPFTVVGITPPGFYGASWGTAVSGFVPATMHPQLSPAMAGLLFDRGNTGFFMMGRLRPSARISQARAAAQVVMERLVKDYPGAHVPVQVVVLAENMSRPSPFVASYVPLIVSAMMTLALLVLLVAAANVANLLYARAADRERELGIRGALGASRWRLLRQLVIESVLLALGAGTLGTLITSWIFPYLAAATIPADFAPAADTGTDWRLFAFAFGASVAAGVLTGLVPALKATRPDVLPLLKERAPSTSHARHPLRSLLVVSQVAVSCLVLVCAGLAVRSLHKLSGVDLGFRPNNLFVASFDLGLQRYDSDKGRRFQTELLERVGTLPGVRDASLGESVPFDTRMGTVGDVTAEGQPLKDNSLFDFIPCLSVDRGFLPTLGVPIAEGRDFSAQDDRSTPRVVIINRAMARRLWPDESPIGKRLLMNQRQPPIEVVGVVSDARFFNMTDRARPLVFRPLAQNYQGNVTLVARTEADPEQLTTAVQQIVAQLDPDLPLYGLRTMEQQIAGSPNALMPLRLGASIAGAQGLIALLLAALGIFGLVSFSVTRRTREIGIRVALGATVSDVVRLVSRQNLTLTLIGLAVGLLSALALTRPLAGLLYGVSPSDASVYAGVALLIAATTLVACWLPVRRATRINPVVALRAE
jgi:predicted permease